MSHVLVRLTQLIALSTSPNENEARNAALLAVSLIRKHGIILTMPERRPTPQSTGRVQPDHVAPASKRKTPTSKRNVKRVADTVEKIVSPLGGECSHCGQRYRAGATVYWFSSGAGMHPRCFEEWAKKQK